jgi:hypothetical protein
VFRARLPVGGTLRGKIQGILKEWSRSRPVNTVSTQSASGSGIRWSAEVRMSRRIVSYAGGSGNCRVASCSRARGVRFVSDTQSKGPHLARVFYPQTIFVRRARSACPFFSFTRFACDVCAAPMFLLNC